MVGTTSSTFFPLKMSMAVKLALACPCFPVLDVDTFTTLQGRPLIMM